MSTKSDLSVLSIEELDALIADATSARQKKVDARRAELMAELEKLGGVPKTPENGNLIGNGKSRGPAEARYREPETGLTWSGRGTVPNWTLSRFRKGEDVTTFLIPGCEHVDDLLGKLRKADADPRRASK